MNIGRWQLNIYRTWKWANLLAPLVADHPSWGQIYSFWWRYGPLDVRRFAKQWDQPKAGHEAEGREGA